MVTLARWGQLALLSVLVLLLAGCAGSQVGTTATVLPPQTQTAATDPAWGYVGLVSQARYTHYLKDLLYCQKGHNRRAGLKPGPQHDLARNAILGRFRAFGLQAAVERVSSGGVPADNVVAMQTGTSRPKDVYVLSAHYDSVGNPGADDDASGVAAVLEAARVMSRHPSEATVYFIAFDAEELDCIGSLGWVRAHANDTVRGMVTVDMIGYNPAGATHNRARIYARYPNKAWVTGMASAMAQYGGLPTKAIADPYEGDYWAFERHGWPGCMLIERADDRNPRYHTARDYYDTAGYLDLAYATKMTRGIVGYFSKVAGFSAVTAPAM